MGEMITGEGVVAWSDTDASGRFHFTSVFRWVENVEHVIIRAAGADVGRVPRRSVTANFSHPLVAGDRYRVELWPEHVGRSSVKYKWRVLCEGRVCVDGEHGVVHVGEDGRASPLPEALRARLEACLAGTESVNHGR